MTKDKNVMPDAVGRTVIMQTETWQKGPTALACWDLRLEMGSEAERGAQTGRGRRSLTMARRKGFVPLCRKPRSSLESQARYFTLFPNCLGPEVKVKEEMQNRPASSKGESESRKH